MEVDEFLDVYVMCLGDDLMTFPCKKGKEGKGTSLVFVPACICPFEANIGAGGLAFRIDANLFCLLMVHASHMFHFNIA